MKKISYGVTVCNEITEIAVLVDTLKEKLREGDEIVIQYDEGSVTDVVMEYLNIMKNMHKDCMTMQVNYGSCFLLQFFLMEVRNEGYQSVAFLTM